MQFLEKMGAEFPDSGYLLCSATKTPISRHWKTQPLNHSQVMEEARKGSHVGWIIPKGYIVVDVDDRVQEELLQKILDFKKVKYGYNRTGKGGHFLFKDGGCTKIVVGKVTAIGIIIDTRSRGTDGTPASYIVLPVNDAKRQWGKWDADVDTLPAWLFPLGFHNGAEESKMLFNCHEGTRNDTLFRWRRRIATYSFITQEVQKEALDIINSFILPEPMDEHEVETLSRELEYMKAGGDESSVRAFERSQEKGNLYQNLARKVLEQYNILSVDEKGRSVTFYLWDGHRYLAITDNRIEAIIYDVFDGSVTSQAMDEIKHHIKKLTYVADGSIFNRNRYAIPCKNGILDVITGEITENKPEHYNTTYIPWNYNSEAEYAPEVDEFMKHLCGGDLLKMKYCYQIVGYCLLRTSELETFFIMKGRGGTGKSTFLGLIRALIGDDTMCSSVSLDKMEDDKYLIQLRDKLVNLEDDNNGKVLATTGAFKSIISGKPVSARMIYHDVVEFCNFATCIIACNEYPKMIDRTDGMFRRARALEFDNVVEHKDPRLMDKLKTETNMEYFFARAVEGAREIVTTHHFCVESNSKEFNIALRASSNPIVEWCLEKNYRVIDFTGTLNAMLTPAENKEWCKNSGTEYIEPRNVDIHYNAYRNWAVDNGYVNICTKPTFVDNIAALYELGRAKWFDGPSGGRVVVFTNYYNQPLQWSPFDE